MGGTRWTGDTGGMKTLYPVHLHLGLYYDANADGAWAPREAVDPFGWSGAYTDPWSVPSAYLWQHDVRQTGQVGSTATTVRATTGREWVNVPAGALGDDWLLEVLSAAPAAESMPSAPLRATSHSLWLRLLELLSSASQSRAALSASSTTGQFTRPFTVGIAYEPPDMPHLDLDRLALYYWDEGAGAWGKPPTTLDAASQQASAPGTRLGNYALMAPLICPAETQEPDDSCYAAQWVTEGAGALRLIDIADDHDWFRFEATAGQEYVIETANLAAGVATRLELYDQDALSLLTSDDDGGEGGASRIEWRAQASGVYYARVTGASGSAYGCDAAYTFH